MFNWRYYFPYLLLTALLSIFFHFSWLPNYISDENKHIRDQEQIYLNMLGTTLVPSLISNDFALIISDLNQIKTSRKDFTYIELFTKDNVRIYPFTQDDSHNRDHLTQIKSTITHDDDTYGIIYAYVDTNNILETKLSSLYKLEILLLSALVSFLFISILFQYFWVSKPIQKMVKATTEVSMGNYDIDLPHNSIGDLEEFVVSFDRMRTTLKNRSEQIKQKNKIQNAVQDIQQLMVETQNPHKVFNQILSIILKITSSKFGFIGDVQYDNNKMPYLNVYAISNIAWDIDSRLIYEKSLTTPVVFDKLDSLYGKVLKDGQPYISLSPSNDTFSTGVPVGHQEFNNFFGIPIYNRQVKFVGMIAIANTTREYTYDMYNELKILWLAIGNLIDARYEQISLSRSEQKLRAVVNNAVDGIITITTNGIIETVNHAAEKIFGYNSNELIGQKVNILMPEQYSTHHDQYIESYLGGGKPKIIGKDREVTGLRKNGEEFPLELSVAEISMGNIKGFTGIVRDISERKQKEEALLKAQQNLKEVNAQLEHIANTDGLTQTTNRRHFDIALHDELSRASRNNYPISLIIFDVDHFKLYNDFYGHVQGDDCLVKVSQECKNLFRRQGELVARYGGEEFAVILPYTNCEEAKSMAEVLRQNIHALNINHEASPIDKYVTVSIGVTCFYGEKLIENKAFINKADEALYQAKESGRNQAVLLNFDPSTNRI